MIQLRLTIIALSLLLSSCSSLTSFHTGRTSGKNTLQLHLNGTTYGYAESTAGNVVAPFIEMGASYGVIDKLDLNFSVSSGLNMRGSLKLQLVGDQLSSFAASIEPGIEVQSEFSQANDTRNIFARYHIPIHLSIHSNNLAYYISPKYTLQVADQINHFAGFSTGIVIQRKNQYFIGGGYFLPINPGSGIEGNLYQIGGGIRFPIKFK